MPSGGWPSREMELNYPLDDARSSDSEEDAVQNANGHSREDAQRDETSRISHISASTETTNQRPESERPICQTPDTGHNHATPNSSAQVAGNCSNIEAHGQLWTSKDVTEALNDGMKTMSWKFTTHSGHIVSNGISPSQFEPYDYFLNTFPLHHLKSIVELTNQKLSHKSLARTTAGEILKFFGLLILMTRVKFSHRKDLWNIVSRFKYVQAAQFRRAIAYRRFEEIRASIRFSFQPKEQGTLSSEAYRWALCDDFVEAFNSQRVEHFQPSHMICVDESISRWNGLGGGYMDVGLPHYVALDRKPEHGCGLQTVACGGSEIMMRISIVKSHSEDSVNNVGENNGTRSLKEFCGPWSGSGRTICADSLFASVQAACAMLDMGLNFIGVVKTATKRFPMRILSGLEIPGRGHWKSLITNVTGKDGNNYELMAVCWVDRNRHYYISTTESATSGTQQSRMRYRRVDGVTAQEQITVDIPSVAEVYHSCASAVDHHNRKRQDDLGMEKAFEVKEWSLRVNTSILACCVVDAYNLYKGDGGGRVHMTQHEFYIRLAEGLIENNYDRQGLRSICSGGDSEDLPVNCVWTHLSPTKAFRKRKTEEQTKARLQRKCRVYGRKSRLLCSTCRDAEGIQKHFCGAESDIASKGTSWCGTMVSN